MRLYSESKEVKTERRPVSDLLLLILFLLSPEPAKIIKKLILSYIGVKH